ncbi:unnamed protein product [Caretta caretta]
MDGLTGEFYHVFWDILSLDLATIWAKSLESRVLPLSGRRAVLALLLKKGDLWNWHPVLLISPDYKVVAKAISLWLRSMLADVVHPDQTYTVLGCTIFNNLYLVRDLLKLGCRDGLSFALLSLDQAKTFDRMDHGYLLGTLRAFGFRPRIVGFLQVLYASTECLVRLNWTLTIPVSFGRGMRQDCPLSGQLYALAIEPFLRLLPRGCLGWCCMNQRYSWSWKCTPPMCSSWSRTRMTRCRRRLVKLFTQRPPPPGSTGSRALAWWSGPSG